jgi:hypothetical protein
MTGGQRSTARPGGELRETWHDHDKEEASLKGPITAAVRRACVPDVYGCDSGSAIAAARALAEQVTLVGMVPVPTDEAVSAGMPRAPSPPVDTWFAERSSSSASGPPCCTCPNTWHGAPRCHDQRRLVRHGSIDGGQRAGGASFGAMACLVAAMSAR